MKSLIIKRNGKIVMEEVEQKKEKQPKYNNLAVFIGLILFIGAMLLVGTLEYNAMVM